MHNILIVDDNRFTVEAIKTSVDWPSLDVSNVLFAYNINQAKTIFNNNKVSLILCDIEMPNGNGLELASWINKFYPETVIVFLTCHANFSYAQEAMRYRAFDYILKPAPIDALTKSIFKALNTNYKISPVPPKMDTEKQISVIQKAISYIDNNIAENLSRESIAKYVYLSPDYLAKIFKKETGLSIMSYISKERIERSKEYLVSTDIPISLIAEKVGIANTSHFIQLFKKETSMTPLSYKKRYGNIKT